MIRINQIKCPIPHKESDLTDKIKKILHLKSKEPITYEIVKKSIDARKKPELFMVYSVNVKHEQEDLILKRNKSSSVMRVKEEKYCFPAVGSKKLKHRPIIVGAGPAGLFAAYQLALCGYAPIVIERGKPVEERRWDVDTFFATGVLNPDSNVQFGEGGAGTFSDGKLNSVVKDPSGRNRFVLETLVHFGAGSQILYDSKPHIGTDVLQDVILQMRRFLIEKGTSFYFHTKLEGLCIERGKLIGIRTSQGYFDCEVLVLAIGHSARDTFVMLKENKLPMEAKNFAVGFRVEHPQQMMNEALYGKQRISLPAAPYKVTANFPNQRGVYSFCMCPGGYVVNASSEEKASCVNGMSYSGRNGKNANSAIIVSVTKEDFVREASGDASDPLLGMYYQRRLEQKNYILGKGLIPQQLFGDYMDNKFSSSYGDFSSETKGGTVFSNLRGLLTFDMEETFMAGMAHFANIIPSFDRRDAILSGMETRTSSPVRILRGERGESEIQGIYPCGEGAGYAGGIMSAAIDGLKIASCIMEQYGPL